VNHCRLIDASHALIYIPAFQRKDAKLTPNYNVEDPSDLTTAKMEDEFQRSIVKNGLTVNEVEGAL
jgi:hypothetical protein